MAARIEYENPAANEWVQPIRKGYKLACCDCGLVHVMDFRIRGGRVQFRADRHPQATTALRKRDGITVKR